MCKKNARQIPGELCSENKPESDFYSTSFLIDVSPGSERSGKIALRIIPTREATARPESPIVIEPQWMLIAPAALNLIPIERTRIRAAMMTLRLSLKSTWLSTMLRTPTAEIIP